MRYLGEGVAVGLFWKVCFWIFTAWKGSIDELTRDQWYDHQYFWCFATMDVLLSDVLQRRNMNLICVLFLLEMHRTPYKRQGISSSMLNSLKVQAQMHSDAFPKDFRFQVLYSKMQSSFVFFFFEKRRCVFAWWGDAYFRLAPPLLNRFEKQIFLRKEGWWGWSGGRWACRWWWWRSVHMI